MTLGERVKLLRTQKGLTQIEFGKQISASGATVSTTESGKTTPDNQTIAAICGAFNVSEQWLRTGEGEMFRPVSRDTELAAFFEDLQGSTPDFRHQLVSVLSRLSVDEWAMLERKAKELLAEMQKDSP